ncbi:DUF4334 domain-containing protein [Algiphilus sp.]|uniref:DUF4334 domain-containing protein n=1 Tax=Algiphilus sp. TaxID=1872431 RepID=UPI0025C0DBB5|nr:DUF4334 domain-containing protein [Algiphilus sp.]MCK5770336.1 DUF4334 domain-containing protein [Algiphilus sp.]
MDAVAAVERFRELRGQSGRIAVGELERVYDALEPVECESILGRWKGGDFDTGHPVTQQLAATGWYGKTFHSVEEVDPLICRGADGELFSDLETMGGGASLWMVAYRGKVSATMVYDRRPVLDHFRRIDDDTLMGVMNGKGVLHDGHPYYFYLQRVDAGA